MPSNPPGRETAMTLDQLHRVQHAKPGTIMLTEHQAAVLLDCKPEQLDFDLLVAAAKVHDGVMYLDAREVLERAGDGRDIVERNAEQVQLAEARENANTLLAELRDQGLYPFGSIDSAVEDGARRQDVRAKADALITGLREQGLDFGGDAA